VSWPRFEPSTSRIKIWGVDRYANLLREIPSGAWVFVIVVMGIRQNYSVASHQHTFSQSVVLSRVLCLSRHVMLYTALQPNRYVRSLSVPFARVLLQSQDGMHFESFGNYYCFHHQGLMSSTGNPSYLDMFHVSNSMGLNPFWEASSCPAAQINSQHFMEPEGSFPRSQEPITSLYPEPDEPTPCPHPISLKFIFLSYF
jgi:hypothetical protein